MAAISIHEELAFLRRNGVDFDVDPRQAEEILAWAGVEISPPSTPAVAVGLVLAVLRLLRGLRG